MVHEIVKSSKCFLELIQIGKPITALRGKKGYGRSRNHDIANLFP